MQFGIRENYKKLQRSLSRTQAAKRSVGIQTDPSLDNAMNVTSPSSSRRAAGRSEAALSPSGREPPDETPPRLDTDGQQLDTAADGGEVSAWDDDDWQGWRSSCRGWSTYWHDNDWWDWWSPSQHQQCLDDADDDWEDLEATLPPILPEEVLGWLLMRRSGLQSASKLSLHLGIVCALWISKRRCVNKKKNF